MNERFLEFSREFDDLKKVTGNRKNVLFSIQGKNLLHDIQSGRNVSEAEAITYLQDSACRKPIPTLTEYKSLGFIESSQGYLRLTERGSMFIDLLTMSEDKISKKYLYSDIEH